MRKINTIFFMKSFLIFFFLLFSPVAVMAHEEHKENKSEQHEEAASNQGGRPQSWMQWIGGFHLIFLHFPIALINMLAIAECLFAWTRKSFYESTAQFLLISSLIFSIPTALLGFIYSYTFSYTGLMETFFLSHMIFGISTAILTIIAAWLLWKAGRGMSYFASLLLLVLTVNAAGYFGGEMTFGPYLMYFPISSF